MPQATLTYLGLGANLGDPIEQMIHTYSHLSRWEHGLSLRRSQFYLSPPMGYSDQPDFINCVVEMYTSATALELLDFTSGIETNMGRLRDPSNQNAPRLLDIDILLFGDQALQTPNLTIPHPRMTQRLFVLLPLLELIADHDSAQFKKYRTIANSLLEENQSIELLRV
ncbi:MAG: 2-amino-4-hydroxy-6-hydroxymethyldihydropteridine diphosphokinase [Bacteroidota bacterium]